MLHKIDDSTKELKQIALDLKLSLRGLIMHNGGLGLTAGTKLQRGTTPWVPSAENTPVCNNREEESKAGDGGG